MEINNSYRGDRCATTKPLDLFDITDAGGGLSYVMLNYLLNQTVAYCQIMKAFAEYYLPLGSDDD